MQKKVNKVPSSSFKKGFISSRLNNNVTIFDTENSLLFTLNESGTFIFDNLKKGYSNGVILKLLMKNFKVSESQAKSDLVEFIQHLKEKGILKK